MRKLLNFIASLREQLGKDEHGITAWHRAGLRAAAESGAHELDRVGMNAMTYKAKNGTTIIIARGKRADELDRAWKMVFDDEVDP